MSSASNGTSPDGRKSPAAAAAVVDDDDDLSTVSTVSEIEPPVDDDEPVCAAADEKDAATNNSISVNIKINRPVYSQQDFDRKYSLVTTADTKTACERLGGVVQHRCQPSARRLKRTLLCLFPFIGIMKDYNIRNDLIGDIVSGLTVGVMHVPQGMAYGMLTSLDPVFGLYASFFPVIIYFFFGTSKHISMGTFAVVSLMIGSAISKSDCSQIPSPTASLSAGNSNTSGLNSTDGVTNAELQCRLGVAVALTFVVGVYQLLMGLFKLGFVTIYLSDPLTRALTMAAAIHVFTSQVKLVFGVSMGKFNGPLKLVYMYIEFFKNITKTNTASLIMALICIVVIYSIQRWLSPITKKKFKMPVPGELFVIIVGTLISYFASFDGRFHMKIVGEVPTGIPAPSFPPIYRFKDIASDAVGIAIVSFTISISMAKLFAKKHSYRLDANQELLAYGITNSASSCFNCFVSCASLSRSLVQESAGCNTQLTGLISCGLLLVVLLAIGPLFRCLPQCVLAAIIIVNLKGVFMQVTDIHALYKKAQYFDLVIWLVTAIAVILTDVDLGLFIGVGFSLLTIVFRTQRPHTSVLGRIPHTDIYDNIKTYPLAREIPGIKIFHFTSSLYYANAEYFVQRLHKKSRCNPELIKLHRAKYQQRLKEAEKKHQKENVKNQWKKQQLTITAVHDNKMFMDDNMAYPAQVTNCKDLPAEKVGITKHVHEVKVDLSDIILDFSSMMFIDTVGISALEQVIQDYKEIGVRVLISGCRKDVFEQLNKAGLFKKSNHCIVYITVHGAVLAAVGSHRVLYEQLKRDINGPLGSVLNETMNTDAALGSDDHKLKGTARDNELLTLESVKF